MSPASLFRAMMGARFLVIKALLAAFPQGETGASAGLLRQNASSIEDGAAIWRAGRFTYATYAKASPASEFIIITAQAMTVERMPFEAIAIISVILARFSSQAPMH